MKKLLVIMFVLLSVSLAFALEVGDKMPDVSGIKVQSERIWIDSLRGLSGPYYIRAEHPGDTHFIIEAHLACGETINSNPFGIFISTESLLYLDKNMDGIIDSIDSPTLTIGQTAPDCLE